MERIFTLYSEGLERLRAWAAEQFPRRDEPETAWKRSIEAKALDAMRGLLPAASLSHVGIYRDGQAYEQLVMRLLASPLPEAGRFGDMALAELRKVIPSFVKRVDMPDRGGAWIDYLRDLRERAAAGAERFGLGDRAEEDASSVRLLRVDGDGGGPAGGLPVRGRRSAGGRAARRSRCDVRPTSAPPRWWSTRSESGGTGGTSRAAASRRFVTGSRSPPTTARSATCSGTGC